MAGPACAPRLNFGTPLTRIVALALNGALPKVPVAGPACVPRLHFVTPLTKIVALAPYGGSSEGPPELHFGTPLTRIVALALFGAHPKVPAAGPACVPRPNFVTPLTRIVAAPPRAHRTPISAHPSRGSSPHRELYRRPQRQRSHAVPPPFWHTPHTFRGPIRSSTEGDNHNCGTHNNIWLGPSSG